MKKFIKTCKSNKRKIIKLWFDNLLLTNVIEKYDLDDEIIKRRYAIVLIDYFFEKAEGFDNSGISTLVIDFLKYLKKYNLRSNDLYEIYTSFKNAIVAFAFYKKIESARLINDINLIHEKLFDEILTVYEKSNAQIEKALNKSIDIVDKYVLMSRTDKDGYITSISSAFSKLCGYRDYELVGKKHNIIKSNDNSEDFYKDLWETITAGYVWHGEIKNLKKNGDNFWVKTTIHPNFDNIGNIIGYDAIYQNITAQVELKNHQSIIIEQSKSAAMGEMISMIAHQWRQPLQAVSILVQKLSLLKAIDGELSDSTLNEVTKQVVSQLDYMSKTIDDFRDYFKPNRTKEKVFIKDVVEKSLDFIDYLFRLNVVKVSYTNESNSEIYVYLNEIVQVLINLSKNSCDAMTEKNIQKRYINIKTFDEKEYLVIEFEDSAGGIDKNILNKIFDPYFSTKNNKNGTGLGLYMSKQIIQRHSNGEIFVENINEGSKFTIKLPLNRS